MLGDTTIQPALCTLSIYGCIKPIQVFFIYRFPYFSTLVTNCLMPISVPRRISSFVPIIVAAFFMLLTTGARQYLHAQNLEQIGVRKGVKFNGSLNLNTVGYYARGLENRRDPFNWFLTGSVNASIFGYSVPLSFSYSNANRSFSQPFNQFSFTPQYKWVKTYVGYSAMTFSPYTLSGHVFLGGGVELSPGKWRIAAMYGRLRKAVPFNLQDTLQYNDASFKRMGYGIKIGYESNGDVVSTSLFAAKDDLGSIPFVLPESTLTPQQNVAISFNGRKKFLKRFFVDTEYAISALNHDIRANREELDSVRARGGSNLIRGLLPENSTSRYYDAFNASVGYQANFYTLQIRYERIAPEYQTLGAYFFNNDMRNITLVPSVKLLAGKLNIAANVGLQKNNLDDTRGSTTERNVGSLNVNYTPSQQWGLTASYSNFSSYTNTRPRSDPFFQDNLDTLNFYQVSQTMNASVMRAFGNKDRPQSLMVSGSYQKASEESSYEGGDYASDFINMNASYSFSWVPSGTTLSLAANAYTNNAAGTKSTFWGPTMSFTKLFMQKVLRTTLSSTYNQSSGGVEASPVLNNRLSLSYSPKPKESKSQSHSFSFSVNRLDRLRDTPQQKAFTELTGTFNYGYTF